MAQAKIIAIAAIDRKRGIGKNNDLIYKIPEDQKHFRDTTMGHPIIFGRKNFDSFRNRQPLDGRTNILVTRNTDLAPDGVIATHSVEEALAEARKLDDEKIYIIGGGEIYKAALPYTDELDLTIIDDERDADKFFPEYEHEFTRVLSERAGEYQGTKFKYVVLGR
ncbi:MAG: dihydrofolate reductase [Patescibacteria group bacterium]|nr:dihydrofolate reductase [Patescibacteria group bacterium]